MSFALKWIQEAAELLKEALHDELSEESAEPHFAHSEKWRERVAELLKPKLPRYGE